MEGNRWAVFIVNPNKPDDPNERYMLTSPVTRAEAEYFKNEFDRLNVMVETRPDGDDPFLPNHRAIRFED
jgi:hypothetical protein